MSQPEKCFNFIKKSIDTLPFIDTLRKQTEAWATATNTKQRGVDWQFTIGDARRKLKSLYPQIK